MTANFQSSAQIGVKVFIKLGYSRRDAKVAFKIVEQFVVEGVGEFIIVGVDLGKFGALQECASISAWESQAASMHSRPGTPPQAAGWIQSLSGACMRFHQTAVVSL